MLALLPLLAVCSAAPTGFHGTASLDNAVVRAEGFWWSAGTAVSLSPSYGFELGKVALSTGARLSASWEWTQPDNPSGRHWDYSDLMLVVGAPEVLKSPNGIFSFTPTLGATVPISLGSRSFGLVTTPLLQLRGDAVVERFRGSLRFDAWRPIYASEPCTSAPCPPYPAWHLAPTLLGEYLPSKDVSLGAELWMVITTRPGLGVDEFNSSKLDASGRPAVTTQLSSPERGVALYATWRFHPRLGVTAEVQSSGAAFSPQDRVALPFIAPEATTFSISLFARTDEQLDPRWLAP